MNLYRYLSPTTLRRIEVFLLSFAGAAAQTPSGKQFLQTHQLLVDMMGAAYIAWRVAEANGGQADPTLPVEAGETEKGG